MTETDGCDRSLPSGVQLDCLARGGDRCSANWLMMGGVRWSDGVTTQGLKYLAGNFVAPALGIFIFILVCITIMMG